LKVLPVVALATVALTAASAAAQAPGLPRTYNATRIDSTAPTPGGAFGWGLWSADLTGDGKQDLLVAQGQTGTAQIPTQVIIYDGATGEYLDTILPPEDNPPGPNNSYVSPELAFVYVETMPDLGSCPDGDGSDPGKICDSIVIGPKDGIPEIIVGARALRVNATDGSIPPTTADPRIGRGYVIDGKTRAVLKRIDMPAVDRQAVLARSGANSVQAFARTMASPQGLPPCAGKASENNDTGVGPCPPLNRGTGNTTTGSNQVTNVNLPEATNGQMLVGPGIPNGARITAGGGTATLTISANATATATGVALEASDYRYPQAVRIGDLDKGGEPDIVVTSRGFAETRGPAGSAAPTSECFKNTTPGPNCGAGKIWTYRGEEIVNTSPQVILDHAYQSIQNPFAQTTGGEYGGNLYRTGDIASCNDPVPPATRTCNSTPDGIPDYLISYRGSDFPLLNPDLTWGLNMGSADVFDGRTGFPARLLVSPEPQQRSTFSGGFNAGRSVGDLGATDTDDILLAAPLQNLQYADQGRLWVFNGDLTAGGGGEQSWNFAMLNDPEPYIGGNFGGAQTGVGDIVGGPGAPANEVLVSGFRFDNFTEASQNTPPDLNFMNATLDKNLMTIPHPEGKTGDGFGVGLTPMGDINKDGFLDFGASAYFADGPFGGQGRAWIFKSDNSPPPPPPTTPAPAAQGPTTPASQGETLKAGSCTNRSVGTDNADRIDGTLAGDEIFGFAGDDTIRSFAGRDCVDGQTGSDRLYGGDDNDKVIGSSGNDRIFGQDGRDDLFGSSGRDRLSGGFDNDMLAGGSGNDDMLGGSGNDRIFGESGNDRIVGGGGRNIVDAGRGDDSIEARNGERDRIICGSGRDRVHADRYDRLNGCEIVTTGGKITNRSVLPPRVKASSAKATGGKTR
jgi:Ca2+-binding RTX toxin-like protein